MDMGRAVIYTAEQTPWIMLPASRCLDPPHSSCTMPSTYTTPIGSLREKKMNIGKISLYAIYTFKANTWRWVCPHNANILTSSSLSLYPPPSFPLSAAPLLFYQWLYPFLVKLSATPPQLSLWASLVTSTWHRGSDGLTLIKLPELLCQPSRQHHCITLKPHNVTSRTGPCLTLGSLLLNALMHNAFYSWLHTRFIHRQLPLSGVPWSIHVHRCKCVFRNVARIRQPMYAHLSLCRKTNITTSPEWLHAA